MSESAYEMKRLEKKSHKEEERKKLWCLFYEDTKMATLTHESISQLRKISHDREHFNDPLRTFFKRVLYIHKTIHPEEKPSVDKRSLSPTTTESSGNSLKEGINGLTRFNPVLHVNKTDDYAPTSPQFSPTYCDVYEPTSPTYDDSPPPKKVLVEQPRHHHYHHSSSTSISLNIPPMTAEMQYQRRSFDEQLTRKLHATASGIQKSSSSAAMHQQMLQRDQRMLEEQLQQHNHRHAVPGSLATDYRAPTPTPSVTSSGSSERSRAQKMILTCPFCFHPHRPEKCEEYYTVWRRKERMEELKLCVHCLEDHDGQDCPKHDYDRWCPVSRNCGQHHFALCPVKNP